MTSLVTPAGRLDRRAVMTEAHRQFRLMRPLGWSFGRCLSFAWAKAREQRGARPRLYLDRLSPTTNGDALAPANRLAYPLSKRTVAQPDATKRPDLG